MREGLKREREEPREDEEDEEDEDGCGCGLMCGQARFLKGLDSCEVVLCRWFSVRRRGESS